jgi:hypothetical protein
VVGGQYLVTGAPDRRRVAQLVRMLTSTSDGEVINAAAALRRELAEAGGMHWLAQIAELGAVPDEALERFLRGLVAHWQKEISRAAWSLTAAELKAFIEVQAKLKEGRPSGLVDELAALSRINATAIRRAGR